MKPNELKAELTRNGRNYAEMANALGISVVAFQRKINGETEFKSSEISALKTELKLTADRVAEIFFN